MSTSRPSSSHRNFHSIEDSVEFPEAQHHPAPSDRDSVDASRQPIEFPGHMELVRYDHGGEGREEELKYTCSRDPVAPSNALSPGWSITTTRGTSDSARSLSSYSQGLHSEDSAPSGYSASSGYVESYDVCSYDNYHPHDDMSDGVASDEGIYYSSSDDANDGGYENLSDEGYYSDESYDGDEYD